MNKIHIVIRALIIISPFFVPWWIVLIAVFAALFFYDSYYESIVIAYVCDILYHTDNSFLGLYGLTLATCLIFVLVKQIKQRLIVY